MINTCTNDNPKARFISIISLRETFLKKLHQKYFFRKESFTKERSFSFSTGFLFLKKKKCTDAERRDMD
jgi:hypothetical protein